MSAAPPPPSDPQPVPPRGRYMVKPKSSIMPVGGKAMYVTLTPYAATPRCREPVVSDRVVGCVLSAQACVLLPRLPCNPQ
jgi:hypothetical protein